MKYRERPAPKEVEALQYAGTIQSIAEIVAFAGHWVHVDDRGKGPTIRAISPDGPVTVAIGDWIVKGDHNDFYPCKPDVFAAKYEPSE